MLGLSTPVFASNAAPIPAEIQGSSFAQALAAYERGDFELALITAKAAGSIGDIEAQVLAGQILRRGEAGRIQTRDAVTWYQKAAILGNSDAMVALGEMGHLNEGGLRPEDAVSWWTKAAQAGRLDAMRALAELHFKGAGVPKNAAEGLGWLRLAADQGDSLAARMLADYKIDNDPKGALKYYRQAADRGDAKAAYAAAIMYAENLSIKPDDKAAARYMEIAAKAGYAPAMADYGLLVYQGLAQGSAQDAVKWFEKSARAGDDQGKFFYAYSLAKGDGVEQNFEEAYFWILQTDKSGIADYDKDIDTLRQGLEARIAPDILARAKARARK